MFEQPQFWAGVCFLLLGIGGILLNVRFARIIKSQERNQRTWHFYVLASIELSVAVYGIFLLAHAT